MCCGADDDHPAVQRREEAAPCIDEPVSAHDQFKSIVIGDEQGIRPHDPCIISLLPQVLSTPGAVAQMLRQPFHTLANPLVLVADDGAQL